MGAVTIELDTPEANANWLQDGTLTFRQKMGAVAYALPGDWRINEYNTDPAWGVGEEEATTCVLIRNDSVRITATLDRRRIIFSPPPVWDSMKRDVYYPDGDFRITVSTTKAPGVIAYDIVRRLLDDVEAYYRDAMTWKKDADAYNEGRAKAIAELEALSGKVKRWTIRVNAPDSVDFHIRSAPLDLAKQLANVVAAYSSGENSPQ